MRTSDLFNRYRQCVPKGAVLWLLLAGIAVTVFINDFLGAETKAARITVLISAAVYSLY